MDDTDKKILNIIQKEFPIAEEPFKVLAEKLGIPEDEVLGRIGNLKEKSIIRRIGAVFDPYKLGFTSTLCAAKVPAEGIKDFIEIVNSYPGVTHNYRRNNSYNIWFTFIAPTEESLEQSIGEIKNRTGIDDIITMRATRTFKIDASFEF